MTSKTIVLFISSVSTSLIAGLFYSYTCSVIPGLNRLSDMGYLSSMQSINRAILNPVFFASFMGTLILLPACSYLHFDRVIPLRFYLLLAATLIYIVGVFGVTMLGNVPLNNILDKLDLNSLSPADLSIQRLKFEGRWNNLNMIRTVSSLLALILMIWCCLSTHKVTDV